MSTDTPRNWTAGARGLTDASLPPDLRPQGKMCLAHYSPWGGLDFVCTRIAGHTGRHAAGDDTRVVAVWE